MSNLDNERDMWDAAAASHPAPAGLIMTQTARTRYGDRVVILTERMVQATAHDGRIATPEGVATWYYLGKPFARGGVQVRYGYLRFDAAVAAERDRRRSQQAWNDTMHR